MKKQVLLLTALCIFAFTANATKWRVNNTPGIDADFTTFKEAHDGASAGDTLYFEGSPIAYGEDDTITKQLVIIGPGYFLNENDSTQAYVVPAKMDGLVFMPGSDGTVLNGMFVNGYIYIGANNITIERSRVYNVLHLYAYDEFTNSINIANAIIKQNYLQQIESGNSASNILIYNNIASSYIIISSNSSAIIKNNIVQGSYSSGISIYASNSTIRNNICNRPIYSVENNQIQNNLTGIIEADIFVLSGSTDGKYKLKEGSPAIGAGYDGVDCGVFGGSQPYVLSGIPAGPHIFDVGVSTSGSNQGGLPVTLKIKTQN